VLAQDKPKTIANTTLAVFGYMKVFRGYARTSVLEGEVNALREKKEAKAAERRKDLEAMYRECSLIPQESPQYLDKYYAYLLASKELEVSSQKDEAELKRAVDAASLDSHAMKRP
jgi:hypothetical protein